jgi:carbon-monoxide dehydrogenase large subunit
VNWRTDALAYANACHAAEVEVDVETGAVQILNYYALQDSGVLINPMLVDGQVQGGIAHGVGNALYEWMGYDDAAQPVTTTFADYLIPTACEIPSMTTMFTQTPSPLNPLGAKGAGEVSTIPTAAAVIAAIEDALQPFNVRIAQVPLTPHALMALIHGGNGNASH